MLVPASALSGAVTVKCAVEVESAVTWVVVLPVIELWAVSVAVTVWMPEVLSIRLKDPAPSISAKFAGKIAW